MGNVPPPPGSSWPTAPQGSAGSEEQAAEAYTHEQDWAGPPGGGRLTPSKGHPSVDPDLSVWMWPPPRPVRTSEFACAEMPEGEDYHRLARTARFRWWTPPLTLLVLAILLSVLWTGIVLAVTMVALVGGGSLVPDTVRIGEIAALAFGLSATALLIPIVMFVVRVVQWRRFGSLLSVVGRLRWGLLARCVSVAALLAALCVLIYVPLAERLPAGEADAAVPGGTEVFAAAVIVILLVVPFQAAAEEMTFRGLVMQLIGSLGSRGGDSVLARVLRSPYPAVLAGGTLFAALYAATHPADGWTTAALAVMGVSMAWLTWRTGGLEAAIGLHLVNSLVMYTLFAYDGRIGEINTGAVVGAGLPLGAGSPLGLLLTAVQMGLFTLVVTGMARRHGVRRTSTGAGS